MIDPIRGTETIGEIIDLLIDDQNRLTEKLFHAMVGEVGVAMTARIIVRADLEWAEEFRAALEKALR
jgi:hypothetical protein